MSSPFIVTEHLIDGEYIRQYPAATSGVDDTPPKICIKQYTPRSNTQPQDGDITIIAGHANAMPKEVYEPLFESILAHASAFKIRGIWIADAAEQSASAIANEYTLGNDPHWFDLSRDLLRMVNIFQKDIRRPIFGLGHSIGATSIAFLSFMHPRLFTGLVCVEPAYSEHGTSEASMFKMLKNSMRKTDRWADRSEAEDWIRNNTFYKSWDPRCLDLFLRYGLRELPSALYPNEKGVTFATPRHQEAFMASRPNFFGISKDGTPLSVRDRETHADLEPSTRKRYPFYRSEPREGQLISPYLRPPVLYIHGESSTFGTLEQVEARLEHTGTGPGGSGGRKLGQVSNVFLKGSHLLPLEDFEGTAKHASVFLAEQAKLWKAREEIWRRYWTSMSMEQKQTMNEDWVAHLTKSRGPPRLSTGPKL